MLGYMSEKQAHAAGFTHHGSYFGIPIWIGDIEREAPLVATKWAPLEYLMPLWHFIEQFVAHVLFPEDEPMFQFKVGKPIEVKK